MTGKHHNWHKAWRRDGASLVHISGLRFDVVRGDGYTDILADKTTLDAFQGHELARGVPLHDLAQRLMRLNKEALQWHQRNP